MAPVIGHSAEKEPEHGHRKWDQGCGDLFQVYGTAWMQIMGHPVDLGIQAEVTEVAVIG